MKKVLVVTSGRSDYGLLYHLMRQFQDSNDYELQIIATGMHLSSEFGMTYKQIEFDGFFINHKIEMLLSSDTNLGVSKSMGIGIIAFSHAIDQLKPDLIFVLGDRYEIFAFTATALVQQIPIAHIHGGEVTRSAIDDTFRHCITKMSNFHFCANEDAKNRILQLGENEANVFMVGGLGLDYIRNTTLFTKSEIEKKLSFKIRDKNILVTYHPETLSKISAGDQIKELLTALKKFSHIGIIFTMPNADTGGRIITNLIEDFVKSNNNAKSFKSLGHNLYLSCIDAFDGVVGNSSSGILEVPSFKKGTLNIGNRQDGRQFASSIIECKLCHQEIIKGIKKLFSLKNKRIFEKTINPYGDGGASEKIIKIVNNINFDSVAPKKFVNYKLIKEQNKK